MKRKELQANFLLLLTAAIWGFGFIAQRFGAMLVEPFSFNACRFSVGAVSLIPLLIYMWKKDKARVSTEYERKGFGKPRDMLQGGILAGGFIFTAAWLQQAGLEDTTAGKAAFLTALYIVLVPIMGLFIKQKVKGGTWIAVAFAIVGVYFLSITEEFTIAKGDMYEIIGAFFWAGQILLIDYYIKKVDSIFLSFVQFVTSAVLSLVFAVALESTSFDLLQMAFIPILYGGIGSVGIAYTLQAVAQKHARPSHAAIILSSEIVFGSVGGVVILHESFGMKGLIGCFFMIIGILLSLWQGMQRGEGDLIDTKQ